MTETDLPLYTRDDVLRFAAGDETLLFAEAERLTGTVASRRFDMCSIINGKSGRCGEDCKWCAQSAHYPTACEVTDLVDAETCLRHARYNEAQGIRRFSIVNSGRRATPRELDYICGLIRMLRRETNLELCASLGLLDETGLRRLYAAGVRRYHCNMEAATAVFQRLCTTHTQEEKLKTIESARRIGMDVCSGGIIGMGETETDRVDLAFLLRRIGVKSIPINILSPIPGTPLEGMPLLSDREILRTVALFRLVHPDAYLRFAGGRARLSDTTFDAALRIGINSAIEGDMLTTLGHTVAQDKAHILAAGYTL